MTYIPSKGETIRIAMRYGVIATATVTRVNPKTVSVMDDAGRKYLVHPAYIINPLAEDEAAEAARMVKQAVKVTGEAPKFKVGDEAVIEAPHAPKWHGTLVKITAVNRTRYKVKAAHVQGFVTVPFRMVKEI
jgi:hypothetical protein